LGLAIKDWTADMLLKGFIHPSDSPIGVATFTVKKKDGSEHVVQDYQPINMITVANQQPMPNIRQEINDLYGAKLFSKFDICSGYNNV
jgi:hypothetical protein